MEKKPTESTVSVTLDMPRQLFKQIEREAKDAERSRSWVIRRLLLRALATNSQEKSA